MKFYDFFDDKYFNNLVGMTTNTSLPGRQFNSNTPCNIYHADNSYIFDLYLPGFSRDNFDISIDNNILTIKGASEFKRQNYIHQEYTSSSKFERSFSIPKNVDIDNIDADYTAGVLSISIPKFEERKPQAKKITVK